jgi:FtsZ-binding cell division protein ZapB
MDKSLTDLIQPSKDDIIKNQKKEINELKKDKEKLQREVQNEQQSRLMEYHTP